MNALENIKAFWLNSYHSDKIAFVFELISFITTVGSSLTLAFTANAPDMAVVYPGFFIGSITGAYAYYRRKIAWPMLLTTYFACVNIFGFGVAVNWW